MKTIPRHTLVMLGASLVLAACSGDDGDDGELPEGDATVVAVGSNFVDTSVFSRVVLPQLYVDVAGIDGVASFDPVVRHRGDYIVVVNRFGFDNVTVLGAADFSLVAQVSTGAGSNPQDAAVLGDSLYVADVNGVGLSVIDLANPSLGATAIDLSELDPDDGKPNCGAVEIVDGDIWVSCGRLDDNDELLAPRGVGVIAVVDGITEMVVDTIDLEHAAPTGFFVQAPAGGDVYIATVPDFFNPADDGCIEVLVPGETPVSDGCLLENEFLGGYVSDMVWSGGNIIASVVNGFDEVDFGPYGIAVEISDVSAVDPAVTDITEQSGRVFNVAACPTGEVVVSESGSGLRIFDADGTELSDGTIDIGAPPVLGGTTCL